MTKPPKRCTDCKQLLPSGRFYRRAASKDGLMPICIDCTKQYQQGRQTTPGFRAWRRAYNQRPSCRLRQRRLRRWWTYGLTPEAFDGLLQAQEGRCQICRCVLFLEVDRKGRSDAVHVDHEHTSGRVRGLLCSDCNRGLGCFHDREEVLISAAQYIKDRPA